MAEPRVIRLEMEPIPLWRYPAIHWRAYRRRLTLRRWHAAYSGSVDWARDFDRQKANVRAALEGCPVPWPNLPSPDDRAAAYFGSFVGLELIWPTRYRRLRSAADRARTACWAISESGPVGWVGDRFDIAETALRVRAAALRPQLSKENPDAP